MKNLKLFAILLILALTFSTLTSCALLGGGTTDTPGTSDNGNSTPNTDKGDDGSNEPPEEDIPVDEECKHSWANGVCSLCKEVCKHVWAEDTCSVCGTVCEHDFDESNDYTCIFCGVQALVPPECKHAWVNGVCQHCGNECEHDFGNDVSCHICGELLTGYYILVTHNGEEYKVRYEITLGEFISEYLGTTYEKTVANGAYWMTVDMYFEKVNLEKDSCFMNYGMILELYLIGGGNVTPPAEDCEHEWIDDYCSLCGITCQHVFADSICTVCGKECYHGWWSDGKCGYCGLPCEHAWMDSYCWKCSYVCMHQLRVDGVCTMCGDVCEHSWNLTECIFCGMICEHTFDGPACTKCGYMSGGIDNPIEVSYNGEVYYVPYSFMFYDFLSLFLGLDYTDSTMNGYWVAVTDGGDVTLGEYDALADFGHSVTVEFRYYGYFECMHPAWYEGYCIECGAPCEHSFDAYNDYTCIYCGMQALVPPSEYCSHMWYSGICSYCGYTCPHETFKEGYCAYCDSVCYHVNWYGGVCDVCGFTCDHYFYHGRCEYCNTDASYISETITVYFEGNEYTVPFGTLLSEFVSSYLYMDFEMSTMRGMWNITNYDSAYNLDGGIYFCDYGNEIYLEYFSYGM